MKTRLLLVSAFLLSVMSGAHAINKCTGQDGKVSYTDGPCPSSSRTQQVDAPVSSPAGAAAASASTGNDNRLEKDKQAIKAMEMARKEKDLAYQIEEAERDVEINRSKMDAELAQLSAKKANAQNNLAGATYENSISMEMRAVVSKYDSRIKIALDRARSLREQLAALRSTK